MEQVQKCFWRQLTECTRGSVQLVHCLRRKGLYSILASKMRYPGIGHSSDIGRKEGKVSNPMGSSWIGKWLEPGIPASGANIQEMLNAQPNTYAGHCWAACSN